MLATATAATSDAYRHTAQLIRVLTVLGQPASPEDLLDQTLIVLSQAFSAVLTATARVVDGRLVVTNSCGLPEGDPAFTEGWPLGGGAAEALSAGRAIARGDSVVDATDVPPSLTALGVRSGAWIPLTGDAGPTERPLLILLRHATEEFGPTELQVLGSVASRLSLVLEARQRSEAVERLAQSSHRLAQFLDGRQLYAEAVRLLPELIDAREARLVTVHGDEVRLGATSRPDGGRERWPRPLTEVPEWPAARRGEAVTAAEGSVPKAGAHDHGPCAQATLCVPVMRDGRPAALLYAARDSSRPFSRDAVETATIFANYVGAAMTNAELYHALRESESSLRLITDSISDLIAVVDAEGRFVYASPSHDRELAHPSAGLLGSSVAALVHSDDRVRVQSALANAGIVLGTLTSKVEYRLRTGQDTWLWVETALRPAPSADGTVVLSSRVIDERRRLEDELRHQATHDPLTGLANRVLTAQRLEQALAGSGPLHVGLLFCDLDKFKAVNDRLGHDVGDELLLQVAHRLRGSLRSEDLLARFGGDEFVMVLDGVEGLADVTEIGRRVARALDAPLALRGERVQVSASVGGVLGVRGEATARAMLRDADAAMYAAKNKGGGLVEVFDDDASSQSLDRLGIRSELLRALDLDQLAVAYQPIFDLPTGAIVGFEALLRWYHPTRGTIPPDVFIPLAEETGAIVDLGDWVLERACAQLAAWQALPGWRQLRMNVNISATQLQRPDLAANTLHVIERSGVHPSDLWLEITEHSSIRSDVTDFATTMHQAGVHFALDDFGTAYSNLSHLKRLPIEMLKIDRSFVAGLGTDPGLVKAVLAIADSLGLAAVAEGIETAEQRTALLALGCESGQGYLLSRPLAPQRATELLAPAIGWYPRYPDSRADGRPLAAEWAPR